MALICAADPTRETEIPTLLVGLIPTLNRSADKNINMVFDKQTLIVRFKSCPYQICVRPTLPTMSHVSSLGILLRMG